MSETYTKLLSSLPLSTVWMEPHPTRIVWVTMLALADHNGDVFASVPGLAHTARVTLDECRVALECFMAPDPYSRNPDNEGRRIEPIPGGWCLLNHSAARSLRDPEARREQNRLAQQRFRDRHRDEVSQSKPESADISPSDQTRPEQEAKATVQRAAPKTAARFEEWWAAYPNKKGKQNAEAKWRKLGLDAKADELIAHCAEMLRSDRGWRDGFIPMGSTYLNQARWQDEPQRDGAPVPTGPSKVTGAAAALAPTESKLERQMGWINNQHRLGQITDAERDSQLREARERYGNGRG